jgi:hypothetical protein
MDERTHPPTPRFARGYPPPQSKVAAPYTELDIFPSLSNGANQSPPRTCRRRGLASLPFAFELPSEAVERVSSFSPTTPAASVLEALRSRTLLDLSCMREFSLLRTKPVPERNLSCLSVSSAYNMQTEQLHLQHLAARGLPQDHKSSDARRPAPVKREASKLVGLRSRLAHAQRKLLHTADAKAEHVTHSPRSPPSIQVASRLREQQRKAQPARPRTEPTSTSATLSVAEQHGFLQEQDLAALMAATGFSRAELFARWARFKALCSMAKSPHGVDKETLRHGVPQLSVEDQFFVDRAFDVLDSDGSGALDWPEFIAALSALEKGDASRRIEFLFHAYDLNSDGFIQRHEVQLFFLASLLVPQTPQALEVARHFVDKIFISLGREQADSIRVDDAMTYLREHPTTDAYSILGRTMVSTPPSTPVPLGIRPRRRPA